MLIRRYANGTHRAHSLVMSLHYSSGRARSAHNQPMFYCLLISCWLKVWYRRRAYGGQSFVKTWFRPTRADWFTFQHYFSFPWCLLRRDSLRAIVMPNVNSDLWINSLIVCVLLEAYCVLNVVAHRCNSDLSAMIKGFWMQMIASTRVCFYTRIDVEVRSRI